MNHPRAATSAGLALCGACLIIGQIAISCWVRPGAAQYAGIVEDIGHTFTGLTALTGLLLWKWPKPKGDLGRTNICWWRTKLLQALAAMIPVALGCIYFHIAGENVERYARAFAALPPFMYLLTVSRFDLR